MYVSHSKQNTCRQSGHLTTTPGSSISDLWSPIIGCMHPKQYKSASVSAQSSDIGSASSMVSSCLVPCIRNTWYYTLKLSFAFHDLTWHDRHCLVFNLTLLDDEIKEQSYICHLWFWPADLHIWGPEQSKGAFVQRISQDKSCEALAQATLHKAIGLICWMFFVKLCSFKMQTIHWTPYWISWSVLLHCWLLLSIEPLQG